MSNSLLSSPSLTGTMAESSRYNIMNTGITDTILLIGHADAEVMYQPYQVINPKKAITFLGSDSKSPLLRAFLQAYNAGCKDIWLYPAAPMYEYEPTVNQRLFEIPKWGDPNTLWGDVNWGSMDHYYSRYFYRLADAYAILADYDFAEIIVPVEAPFQDTGEVDFLTQLVNHCENSFVNTGSVCIGIIGTRHYTAVTQEEIDEMVNDTRIKNLGDGGKFVLIAGGECAISVPQMSTTFVASVSTSVAAMLAVSNLNRSIAGLIIPNVSALVGNDIPDAQVERLAQAKINMAVRTTRGKRGYSNETRLATDNTLGQDGSDYWSMAQMHIVANTINQIRYLGDVYIGRVGKYGLGKFKEDVQAHFKNLVQNRYIRDYTLRIEEEDLGQTARVFVSILPIFGVRQISFRVEVGPGT